jgi:hypothetical protein
VRANDAQRAQESRFGCGRSSIETEKRCTKRADGLSGKKTAVLEKARQVKREATEMMRTYLGDDADALDGFEFLTMAEWAKQVTGRSCE